MAENIFDIPSESNLSREQLPYLESDLQIDFQLGNKEHMPYEEVHSHAPASTMEASVTTPEVQPTPVERITVLTEILEQAIQYESNE